MLEVLKRAVEIKPVIWADTWRYKLNAKSIAFTIGAHFFLIHKYCNEISVAYSVCSTCHHCIGSIRVLITGMWKCIGCDSFVCCFRFWSNLFWVFGFWMTFSTVLRFLIGPNAPLLKLLPSIRPTSSKSKISSMSTIEKRPFGRQLWDDLK